MNKHQKKLEPRNTRITGAQMGKREANKLDKIQRISRAAEELFSVKGYDEATMREIAKRANVALGTLFLYASNKRDLLFLIANDMLEILVATADEILDAEDDTVMLSYLTVTVVHLRAFGMQPELFRLVMRELLFYDSGEQAKRAVENRSRMLNLFRRILQAGRERGEIEPGLNIDHVAWILFSIQQAEVRRWLSLNKFDLTEGIHHAWATSALVFNGISNREIREKPSKKEALSLFQRAMAVRIDTIR